MCRQVTWSPGARSTCWMICVARFSGLAGAGCLGVIVSVDVFIDADSSSALNSHRLRRLRAPTHSTQERAAEAGEQLLLTHVLALMNSGLPHDWIGRRGAVIATSVVGPARNLLCVCQAT